MKSPTGKRVFTRTWFYIAVLLLVLTVWGLQVRIYHQAFQPPSALSPVITELSGTPAMPNDWQKMSMQAMTDTNGLLTTLATALLGALGLMMGRKVSGGAGARHMWAAFLGAIGAGLSLYFGYVSHLNLLAMISNETFDSYNRLYLFFSHAQFYSLLAGTFFFADFAVHDFNPEIPT
jgi:hypothetical protein